MGQHRIHLANIARLKRGGTAGGRTLGPGKEHPATRLPIQPMHGEQRSAEVRKHPPFERISTRAGTRYPATLVTTADHDDRVVPAHSFKFAAELQDKQACSNPVVIRIETNAGHGAGKPTAMVIEEAIDKFATGSITNDELEAVFGKLEANIQPLVSRFKGTQEGYTGEEGPLELGDVVFVPKLQGEAIVESVSGPMVVVRPKDPKLAIASIMGWGSKSKGQVFKYRREEVQLIKRAEQVLPSCPKP